jgi:single-stranded DNA-binding protein
MSSSKSDAVSTAGVVTFAVKYVCNFSVATSEEWLDKATKQKRQKVEWHNISVFGKLAEIVSSYCYKGSSATSFFKALAIK